MLKPILDAPAQVDRQSFEHATAMYSPS